MDKVTVMFEKQYLAPDVEVLSFDAALAFLTGSNEPDNPLKYEDDEW